MPKFFNYQVFTIDTDYTHYYAQFIVSDTEQPNTTYRWDFGDNSAVSDGDNILHEYTPGEYVITLSKTTDSINYSVVESAIAFVVAIPRSKLANNQLQPINTVDLYPTTGLKQSISLPVKMLELGDTYSQSKSDYVNEYEESWSITTGLLTGIQKDRLEATFQQLGGVAPFNFVPVVGETAVSLVCENWSVTQSSVTDYQLSIQAKRYWSRPRISFVEPPFRGGQCDTIYQVRVTYTYFNTDINQQRTNTTATGGFRVINSVSIKQVFINGNQFYEVVVNTNAYAGVESPQDITIAREFYFMTLNNIIVTRVDGLPDNCGDPQV